MKDRILEICICNIEDAIQAQHAGAGRLELCEDLSEGGTTPQLGWVKEAKQQLAIPIHILIRPRAGNFIYERNEKIKMLKDIDSFLKLNCDGIVIGALTQDGEIDIAFMKECLQLTVGKQGTFHKAIDQFQNPSEKVELLSQLGFHTILSSGGKSNVFEGLEELKKMKKAANQQIEIMPGGGLRSANIESIFIQLNPFAFHSAARTEVGLFDSTEVRKMAQFLNSIPITTT